MKYINTAPAIKNVVANNVYQNDEFKRIRDLGWTDEDLQRFYFLSHYFLHLLYSNAASPVGEDDYVFKNTLKWKLFPEADETSLINEYKAEILKAIETIYQSSPFTEKDLLKHLEITTMLNNYYNSFGVSREGHPPALRKNIWNADDQIIEIANQNGQDMMRYKAVHSRIMKAFKQLYPQKVFPDIPTDFIPGAPLTIEEIKIIKKYEPQISKAWADLGHIISRFAIVY